MEIRYKKLKWEEDYPIFFSEAYLRASGSEFGWLEGIMDGEIKGIVPFTAHERNIFKAIRFHHQTYHPEKSWNSQSERLFLNSLCQFLKQDNYDTILQSPTYGLFRAYPADSIFAPFGTYCIDLQKSQDALWENIHRHHKKAIQKAINNGVIVRIEKDTVPVAQELVNQSLSRSSLFTPDLDYYENFMKLLGSHAEIFTGYHKGVPKGCLIFAFSRFGAYCLHAGGTDTHVLHWEAIKYFNSLGVKRYDLVGARINPKKGTKFEHMAEFKKRFGSNLQNGFLWKCQLNKGKALIRDIISAIGNPNGDIIDSILRNEEI
jgi:hypothetical protein